MTYSISGLTGPFLYIYKQNQNITGHTRVIHKLRIRLSFNSAWLKQAPRSLCSSCVPLPPPTGPLHRLHPLLGMFSYTPLPLSHSYSFFKYHLKCHFPREASPTSTGDLPTTVLVTIVINFFQDYLAFIFCLH